MEWLPIETAPKDGTFYLAFGENFTWVQNEPPGCYAGIWHFNKSRNQWRGSASLIFPDPTHWMPLPPPPKATE